DGAEELERGGQRLARDTIVVDDQHMQSREQRGRLGTAIHAHAEHPRWAARVNVSVRDRIWAWFAAYDLRLVTALKLDSRGSTRSDEWQRGHSGFRWACSAIDCGASKVLPHLSHQNS